MKKKNKIALMGISGLLATSLAVGGATYALFKDSVTNGANTVTAGTLKITAKRDDVPNEGPMFYSVNKENNFGAMATGYWAPGDKHTRGLFLKNTGSLEAKLTTITAKTADSNGNPITSGQQYQDDMLFAGQAEVKIWEIQEWDQNRGARPITRMNPDEMDLVMQIVNDGYKLWQDNNPDADLSTEVGVAMLLNAVNEYMLNQLNERNGNTNNNLFKVVKMYDKRLDQLVNDSYHLNQNSNSDRHNVVLKPGESALLGFTLEFRKNPRAGVDKNALQGKEVYFNFGTDWVQTKNNN
ncbi:TasA family protein [Neobacillus sp. SCS-31]|uniref:TasA family protein n=1 Tax=Neobacillus oceani TaxID=3115292 RepID=UPI003906629E